MPHHSAGVEIRELSTPDELDQLTRIFDDVWHPDPTNRPVTTDMLRALSHAGNYVAGAFIGGHLAGGSVAFFGTPLGEVLHSHITGVSRLGAGHRVGSALKSHQAQWAQARGISTITWTFDPLVARNAYFNITKLGAVPVRYYRGFYPAAGSELGDGDEADRLLMHWPVPPSDPAPADPATPADTARDTTEPTVDDLLADGAVSAIDLSDPERPTAVATVAESSATGSNGTGSDTTRTDATVLIPVPRDIESLRRHHPVQATRWRHALREALAPLLDGDDGTGDAGTAPRSGRPVTFLRSGCYVFGAPGTTAR